MLIELGGVRLLTDPVLRRQGRPPAPPPASAGPGRSYRVRDAVLISHLHYDHLDLPSLRRLGAPRVLAPRGSGGYLVRAGVRGVEELSAGEAVEVGGVPVTAVPALHDDRRRPGGGPRADPLGFVAGADRRVYFAGDTDLFAGMEALGRLDAALLPVAGWGPALGPGHMDAAAAARAAALIRPAGRGADPLGDPPPAVRPPRALVLSSRPASFAARVAEEAAEVEVAVLDPGESLELSPVEQSDRRATVAARERGARAHQPTLRFGLCCG